MAKTVTIYSTPWCVYCHAAKEFFNEHKVAYQDKDVQADQVALQEMVQKSGQMGVPVIDIDGSLIVGFDRPRLTELLGIKS
ncbi:NrdH-redoxin [Candidatus Microgenomates bacterium]|nr:NrdH-redoxin [Candidatus Microgenomates bacterium]